MQSVLRYLAYLAAALILFALTIAPLIWFSWVDLATFKGGKGSAGSIVLLFLGGIALIAYAVALLSFPFAAKGQGRLLSLIGLLFKGKKTERWAKLLPWVMACLHFAPVPLLTILPLLLSAEGGDVILVLAAALVVFVGTGVIHHVARLLALRMFPREEAPGEPKEDLLRSLLPWS